MKKYMLVYVIDGEQDARFSNNYLEISNAKMDIECGLGGYAEIYERMETDDGEMEYVMVEV